MGGGELADGTVEQERVVVWHEEGLGRVVVEYVAVHCGAFTFQNIGRIADDEVEGWGEGGKLLWVKNVHFHERDVCMVGCGIVAGYVQGLGRDVGSGNFGMGKGVF